MLRVVLPIVIIPAFVMCKDSANRRQYKINPFIFIVEVPPILLKDSANRIHYKITPFIFIVEVPPI